MLGMIDRQVFDSLEENALIWACIHPLIHEIRGKDPIIKTEVYSSLTKGQRALLMFQILYGHTSGGAAEFFQMEDLLSIKGIWNELKKSMQYFGDDAMLSLLSEIEKAYTSGNTGRNSINAIDRKLQVRLPESIKLICSYIRSNPGEFVRFGEKT
jgi:hypothetical protein